ncbi:MAG: Rrf2 family transcriptional regulator [Verrucomicrobia bacterium]|nr:MAG: Rrf2 family transcriptional regulator [Verrucomicrobiota bacterium]
MDPQNRFTLSLAFSSLFCFILLMRISQKLEYACRALAQLAKRHDAKNVTRLDELAQREAISANFLVQILNDLRRAGLVESKRGKEGGYLLAKSPKQIRLAEIVEAIDPALLTSSVSAEGESGSSVAQCWQGLAKEFQQKLQHITLEEISLSQGDAMFYI